MTSKRWAWIAAAAVLFAGLTNAHAHVHFCFDGQEPPTAIHLADSFPWLLFLGTSIPVWLGFLGAFILTITQVLAQVPPTVVGDPMLEPHPWDAHVHSLDAHHAHH